MSIPDIIGSIAAVIITGLGLLIVAMSIRTEKYDILPLAIVFFAPALVAFSVIYGHYEERNCHHEYGHWFAKSQYTVAAHVCKKCGHEEQVDIDSVELSKLKAEETK